MDRSVRKSALANTRWIVRSHDLHDCVEQGVDLRTIEKSRSLTGFCHRDHAGRHGVEEAISLGVIKTNPLGEQFDGTTSTSQFGTGGGVVFDLGQCVDLPERFGERIGIRGSSPYRRERGEAERDEQHDEEAGIPHGDTHEGRQAMGALRIPRPFVTPHGSPRSDCRRLDTLV